MERGAREKGGGGERPRQRRSERELGIPLHHMTVQYLTLHSITSHYITLHYITVPYLELELGELLLERLTLHYITFQYLTWSLSWASCSSSAFLSRRNWSRSFATSTNPAEVRLKGGGWFVQNEMYPMRSLIQTIDDGGS